MATETNGAAAAEHAQGMPQLDFATFPNQIFWLVVTLVVLYLILSRVALPRIAEVLAERHGTIAGDIAAAEEMKLKAVAAEEAYKKALADARTQASKIVAEARAEIQKDLDAALEKAEAEIAARSAEAERRISDIRATAEDSVGDVARDTALAVIEAVMPGAADAKAVAAAVGTRLKGGAA